MKKFILLSAFFLCLAPILRGQYWIYDDLSEPKFDVSSTSLGTKVYIAGGDNGTSAVLMSKCMILQPKIGTLF
jgi:hypothetical protein